MIWQDEYTANFSNCSPRVCGLNFSYCTQICYGLRFTTWQVHHVCKNADNRRRCRVNTRSARRNFFHSATLFVFFLSDIIRACRRSAVKSLEAGMRMAMVFATKTFVEGSMNQEAHTTFFPT
jgi:hypothetical protein